MGSLAGMRKDYGEHDFDGASAGDDPLALFAAWLGDAARTMAHHEANAMSLATVAADGTPSVRIVLLKDVDPVRGAFTWFTGLESRKAREALAGGRAAVAFYWPAQSRQVRIVGRVDRVPREAAAAYFATRPRASQISAVASDQSRAIASRRELEDRAALVAGRISRPGPGERGPGTDPDSEPDGLDDVPMPTDWGGLALVADEIEFWQGRAGRLHDRIAFLRLDAADEPCAQAAVEAAGGAEHVRQVATRVADSHGTAWLRLRLCP